jgi:predicted TPR repeat methyltransferase
LKSPEFRSRGNVFEDVVQRLVLEDYALRLPDTRAATDQDEEWVEVAHGNETRRLRFHDYADIYSIPLLYERLVYEELHCESPRVAAALLSSELARRGLVPEALRILDLGAGNGIVGEELTKIGVEHLVGVDIIPEAAAATERDRPGLYSDYLVADLLADDPDVRRRLESHDLNALACVAVLGFGDIPPEVFVAAVQCLDTPALVVYTIKEAFASGENPSGFSDLVERLDDEGTLVTLAKQRYQHRLSWAGEPLYYYAVLAEKRAEVASVTRHASERPSSSRDVAFAYTLPAAEDPTDLSDPSEKVPADRPPEPVPALRGAVGGRGRPAPVLEVPRSLGGGVDR